MAAGRILKTNWRRIPGLNSRTAREDLCYIADYINRLRLVGKLAARLWHGPAQLLLKRECLYASR